MAAGLVSVAASVYFFYTLRQEERNIEKTNQTVLTQMVSHIDEISKDEDYVTDPYSREMVALMVDGYEYVGCLSVPALNLELPVMSRLDEYRLKLAPCLYQGTAMADNMIIGAHNYKKHFAALPQLVPGDRVVFTDMTGQVYFYKVAALETLMPYQHRELTETDCHLTLFTCTYGGRKRTVIRCERDK